MRIAIHTVGVCGSDVHYYTHGRIGDFVVNAPMVLGHEAAGVVTARGANVKTLDVGDRVCMEPGIPNLSSRASKLGLYNVDPDVRFWATPPVHGVLTANVVHPAAFTFKLPDNVSFAEGAMVEPFAVGMQAAARARIAPGDVGAVVGAGPIGIMVALAALAGGCSKVFVADFAKEKLAIVARYPGIVAVDVAQGEPVRRRQARNRRAGAPTSRSKPAARRGPMPISSAPRGRAARLVLVGLPIEPVAFDVPAAISKELRIETVFRYANVFDRALALIASGKVDLKPLVSETFAFKQSIAAFERAAAARPSDVKLQIRMQE